MKTKLITLPPPYDLQKEIEDDTHRFRVLACGRRWGKTVMAMREAFQIMLRRYAVSGKKQRIWVVAPTFPLVKEDWLVAEDVLREAIVTKHQTEMKMTTDIGTIEFKSAERDDEGLRGAGLDGCVVDEASRVSKKAWEQGIRPALSDKLGLGIFISTPKGRNWFYEMYVKGQEGSKDIKSWRYATYTNPYFPKSEWEVIKVTTPEMILRQEYLADFLEDEATVFKNISRCFRGTLEEPIAKEFYTIGIDLGKSEDFTVVTVMRNSTKQLVDIYKENKLDWSVQKDLIRGIVSRYPHHLAVIDSTGLGDPIADDLRKSGVNIQDYGFTNKSKGALVEQLIIAIEQGLIGIPICPQTNFLIEEIKSFNYEILSSGRVRYSAPEGLHDDGVISLSLAVMGLAPLLYQKIKPQEPVQKNTFAQLDDYYKMLDMSKKLYPYLNNGQIVDKLRDKQWKRLMRVN